jgi:hypothetical protein
VPVDPFFFIWVPDKKFAKKTNRINNPDMAGVMLRRFEDFSFIAGRGLFSFFSGVPVEQPSTSSRTLVLVIARIRALRSTSSAARQRQE